jgi:hypothetical protein
MGELHDHFTDVVLDPLLLVEPLTVVEDLKGLK